MTTRFVLKNHKAAQSVSELTLSVLVSLSESAEHVGQTRLARRVLAAQEQLQVVELVRVVAEGGQVVCDLPLRDGQALQLTEALHRLHLVRQRVRTAVLGTHREGE